MKKIELITFIFITLVIGTVVASCSGSSTQTGTSNYPLNPTNTPNEETFSLVGVWKYEWDGEEHGYSIVSFLKMVQPYLKSGPSVMDHINLMIGTK